MTPCVGIGAFIHQCELMPYCVPGSMPCAGQSPCLPGAYILVCVGMGTAGETHNKWTTNRWVVRQHLSGNLNGLYSQVKIWGQAVQAVETASTKTLVASKLRVMGEQEASGQNGCGWNGKGQILQGLWAGSGLWAFSEYDGSYWRIFSSNIIAADRC